LTIFPGVSCSIGEFSVNKEIVSAKIAGEKASLLNPALDRLLDFAGEVGLVAIMHNDIDMPFPKPGQPAYQETQLRDLFLRHPTTTIIWPMWVWDAHSAGRIGSRSSIAHRPILGPATSTSTSPGMKQPYIVATPETPQGDRALINRHPDRFLFGTDEVAPTNQKDYPQGVRMRAPLFAQLTADASEKDAKAELHAPLR
jgi:hypothetical protein